MDRLPRRTPGATPLIPRLDYDELALENHIRAVVGKLADTQRARLAALLVNKPEPSCQH